MVGLDVDVDETDSGLVLRGKLKPPSRAAVELYRDDSTVLPAVEANDRGQFRIDISEGGRVRLRVTGRSVPTIETSWITI